MLEFFTYKPQYKEQLMPLPHLWNTVWRKRLQIQSGRTVPLNIFGRAFLLLVTHFVPLAIFSSLAF